MCAQPKCCPESMFINWPVKELEFNIESWGQFEAKDIFSKSIDIIESNLNELGKTVK